MLPAKREAIAKAVPFYGALALIIIVAAVTGSFLSGVAAVMCAALALFVGGSIILPFVAYVRSRHDPKARDTKNSV